MFVKLKQRSTMSDVVRNNIGIKRSTRFTSVTLPTQGVCEWFNRYDDKYGFIVTKIKYSFKEKFSDAITECDKIQVSVWTGLSAAVLRFKN